MWIAIRWDVSPLWRCWRFLKAGTFVFLSSKLDEGLDAIVEDGGEEEALETPVEEGLAPKPVVGALELTEPGQNDQSRLL